MQRIVDSFDKQQKTSAQLVSNQLRDMGVRYRGIPVTKGMVLGVGQVHELFDDQSHVTLRRIDQEFGRDLLSTNYTKLSRFMTAMKTRASSVATDGKIMEVPVGPG